MLSDYLEKAEPQAVKVFGTKFISQVKGTIVPPILYRIKAALPRDYLQKALEALQVSWYCHASSPFKLAEKCLDYKKRTTAGATQKHTTEPIGAGRFIVFPKEVNLNWGSINEVLSPTPAKKAPVAVPAPLPPPPPVLEDYLSLKETTVTGVFYTVKKPFYGSMLAPFLKPQGLWVPSLKKYLKADEVVSLVTLDLKSLVDLTPPKSNSVDITPPKREAKPGECNGCFVDLPKSELFKFKAKNGKWYCKNCYNKPADEGPIPVSTDDVELELYTPIEPGFHLGSMVKPDVPNTWIVASAPIDVNTDDEGIELYSETEAGFRPGEMSRPSPPSITIQSAPVPPEEEWGIDLYPQPMTKEIRN